MSTSWVVVCSSFRRHNVSPWLSFHDGLTVAGFPGGLVVKNPLARARDSRDGSLIPELGRSPGGGNGKLLQYSCQGARISERREMGRGAWRATVYGVAKSWIWLSDWAHTHLTADWQSLFVNSLNIVICVCVWGGSIFMYICIYCNIYEFTHVYICVIYICWYSVYMYTIYIYVYIHIERERREDRGARREEKTRRKKEKEISHLPTCVMCKAWVL